MQPYLDRDRALSLVALSTSPDQKRRYAARATATALPLAVAAAGSPWDQPRKSKLYYIERHKMSKVSGA